MANIQILDCTLRDGGYVNNWDFGNSCIKKIVNNLIESNIDYIECGFLKNCIYKNDKSW
jgi:4-hydroxy 2-oxovalerate aldolase